MVHNRRRKGTGEVEVTTPEPTPEKRTKRTSSRGGTNFFGASDKQAAELERVAFKDRGPKVGGFTPLEGGLSEQQQAAIKSQNDREQAIREGGSTSVLTTAEQIKNFALTGRTSNPDPNIVQLSPAGAIFGGGFIKGGNIISGARALAFGKNEGVVGISRSWLKAIIPGSKATPIPAFGKVNPNVIEKMTTYAAAVLVKRGFTLGIVGIGVASTWIGGVLVGMWGGAEAPDTPNIILNKLGARATKTGDWTLYDQTAADFVEVLDGINMEEIATPFGFPKGIIGKYEANKLGVKALIASDQDFRQRPEETTEEFIRRTNKDIFDRDSVRRKDDLAEELARRERDKEVRDEDRDFWRDFDNEKRALDKIEAEEERRFWREFQAAGIKARRRRL